MAVQLFGYTENITFFDQGNNCCNDAKTLTKKIKDILKDRAANESNASMPDGDALLRAMDLLNWGAKGFEHDLKKAYKASSKLTPLIDMLVRTNIDILTSELIVTRELQNILQRKITLIS